MRFDMKQLAVAMLAIAVALSSGFAAKSVGAQEQSSEPSADCRRHLEADIGFLRLAEERTSLSRGDIGPTVAVVQSVVNAIRGETVLEVDGRFGSTTEDQLFALTLELGMEHPSKVFNQAVAKLLFANFERVESRDPDKVLYRANESMIVFRLDLPGGRGFVLKDYVDDGLRVCSTENLQLPIAGPDFADAHLRRLGRGFLGRSLSDEERSTLRALLDGEDNDCIDALADVHQLLASMAETQAFWADQDPVLMARSIGYKALLGGYEARDRELTAQLVKALRRDGAIGLVAVLEGVPNLLQRVEGEVCGVEVVNSPTLTEATQNCENVTSPALPTDLVKVSNMTVHICWSAQIQAMVQAAADDGIKLRAWGHRSHQRQHELRAINGCPDGALHRDGEQPSDFSASSTCRVPTARPGASLHEFGLALDFYGIDGRAIDTGDAEYQWLISNAEQFGVFPFDAEPWHFSTNGR